MLGSLPDLESVFGAGSSPADKAAAGKGNPECFPKRCRYLVKQRDIHGLVVRMPPDTEKGDVGQRKLHRKASHFLTFLGVVGCALLGNA